MTKTRNELILLSGRPALGGPVGKMATRVEGPQDMLPASLLDCHDGSIRKSGQVLVQAAKTLTLYRKGEILAQPARRKVDFIADLIDGPVKDALQGTSPLRSLLVIGEGTLRRFQLALVDDEGKTRARADISTLQPSGRGQAVTLASVQGVRGYDKAFAALREYLRGTDPARELVPADLISQLFPDHEPYDPKPETVMASDETAFDAANDIIQAHIGVMRRNEAGIIADHDTEFLHDYRVALRKIRSVASLFRGTYDPEETDALKRRLSDLMSPTGRLRDLDVYLLGRTTYYDLLPPTLHDGLTLMFDIFSRERRREHRKLARMLEGADYKARMAALEAIFADGSCPARGPDADHPVLDYACELIWKRYRKVCRIAATINAETPDDKVHELRIGCKKLRYLMELFAPLFPRAPFRALLAPLKELQENLGLFNDYSVQQNALQKFLQSHPSRGQRDDLAMATSIGALIAVLHQRQIAERARVVTSFRHFDSPAIQHRFASLFRKKGA